MRAVPPRQAMLPTQLRPARTRQPRSHHVRQCADFLQASDRVRDNLAQSFQRRLSFFNFVWHATAAGKPEPCSVAADLPQWKQPRIWEVFDGRPAYQENRPAPVTCREVNAASGGCARKDRIRKECRRRKGACVGGGAVLSITVHPSGRPWRDAQEKPLPGGKAGRGFSSKRTA